MKRFLVLPTILLVLSCQPKQKHINPVTSVNKNHIRQKKKGGAQDTLTEFFADSSEIGRKSFNKVEVAKYTSADTSYVVIRFYSKKNNGWALRNEFCFAKDNYRQCEPDLSDFNNDGLNDLTYVSATAARLSNVVTKLFIYDRQNDKLIYIKNSEDYPNISYNKKLNCVDAWLISGCNETVFGKIEQDSLRKFAKVSRCDSVLVSIYDKHGNETVISRKKASGEEFIRYKNYRPLEENKD